MKKLNRVWALVLCFVMCMNLATPALAANETNNSGVTFSLELSESELTASDQEQTVTLTLKASDEIAIKSMQYSLTSPESFKIGTPTYSAGEGAWNDNNAAWMSSSDVTTDTLATISVTVPAGTAADNYTFSVTNPDTKLIIIDTMQKIREIGGTAYSYANDYDIIGSLKQFADKHCLCVLNVHHTRKQSAEDAFETISGTTGLLGCADGALLMRKKKRTSLDATLDVVGRDQQDQILYLTKDPKTQLWTLDHTETDLYREPPDPVLEAVARLVTPEQPEWTGSPSELADVLNMGMAANTLTKYLNIKYGRLTDEYGIHYENKAKHIGRRITLVLLSLDPLQ